MISQFNNIAERWFLSEPALFALLCRFKLQENNVLSIKLRTHKRTIEYNPKLIEPLSEQALEELLFIEMIRIFLKHPYQRTSSNIDPKLKLIASDVVLTNDYQFNYHHLKKSSEYDLEEKLYYELYTYLLKQKMGVPTHLNENSINNIKNFTNFYQGSDGYNSNVDKNIDEYTEYWDEDPEETSFVNEVIKKITSWGSIPENLISTIEVSTKVCIDYRKVLRSFHASVISTHRRLTRRKPNRRYGFDAMGSTYDFSTNLLIAIDVSGSITDKSISNFLGIINRFFKYGIKNIELIQFDTEVKPKVLSMKKASKSIEIIGRGGTNFQSVFDYLKKNNHYDGLIIFTDGYAPEPTKNFRTKTHILWVCENEKTYEIHKNWMQKTGKSCFIKQIL